MDLIQFDEELTDLLIDELKVLQKRNGFRFSIDAVLLSHFATLKSGSKVLDLGTGTGVIPLLLTTRAKHLNITAIELQEDIANMARRSIAVNNLDCIQIINGDLRYLPTDFNQQYDLVVSNPPYFAVNEGKISPIPSIATSRHEISCTLEDLIKNAARFVKSNGRFALIHRAERLTEILVLFNKYKLGIRRIRLIHPYVHKGANLVMVEGLKNGKDDVKIEPPLIIYQGVNQYSEEVLEYYEGSR